MDDHEPSYIPMQVMAALHADDRAMKRCKDPAAAASAPPRRRHRDDSEAAFWNAQRGLRKSFDELLKEVIRINSENIV